MFLILYYLTGLNALVQTRTKRIRFYSVRECAVTFEKRQEKPIGSADIVVGDICARQLPTPIANLCFV